MYLSQGPQYLSVRMISPYERRNLDPTMSSRPSLSEEDSFNAVMGNICRAINAGFKDIDSFLDAFLEPVKSHAPGHSPHAGQSGPKTRYDTYNPYNRYLKRLPW